MNSKKVLFVATVTSHINAFHIPYLKLFKEQGYEVHVASYGEQSIEYCDKHFNIPFERFPFKLKNYKSYKELKRIVNENEYEIIHCHTPVGGVLTRLAAKKARKNGTRVFYTAHGFHFYKGAPLLNWLIYYPLEKWLAKYTDCLITINKEDYERAKQKFKIKRIEFVYGVGVNEEKFNIEITQKEKQEIKQQLGLNNNDFVITYVAELSKRKNQGMLLKAANELINKENMKNIKVLLVGKDNMNKLYHKMAKNLNIENNIFFLGHRNDIPKLLKISDLYVSTSKQEGLPINIIEAMTAQLPIIATDCRGNRDLIDNCVEIDNYKELAIQIKKMQNSKKEVMYNIDKYKEKKILEQMKKIYTND